MTLAAVGLIYLLLGFVLWVHAWVDGVTTHTLCGCGDPALFLWFWQWPATAVAHGENPFFSTALFHPMGVNLLAQTSVMGLSVPLIPVTWIWGPVASLNVAATLTPAISAFTAFVVVRRWAPWTPAAFLGGLLFGFSPFMLSNLEFTHMMTAALMLLPLFLLVLDEILMRQRHSPITGGILLGVLVFGQFFLSSELLAIVVVVAVAGVVVLAAAAFLSDRDGLRRRAPHAAVGLGVGLGAGVVLLAWPVWFALEGPGHLSGLIWPNIGIIGGYVPSNFVSPDYVHGANVFLRLGGDAGPQLGSSAYLGWGLVAVLAAGLAAFWRDRRLWFFGFVLVFCGVCALGERRGQWWEVARVFAHIPVLENVIQQRFMAVGFLAAAVMLAIILDKVHSWAPDWRGVVGAAAAAAVALVPIVATFAPRLPYTMQAVLLPRWYSQVAPSLPSNSVLLSYPAPFSGIQASMSWQAVNRMHYSQAGGGGPQGTVARAGSAAPGFRILSNLALGVGQPRPSGTAAELGAVRHALRVWKVTTVVIATDPVAPSLQQGNDPTYAASFMTAALGRLPVTQAGAWVWYGVSPQLDPPLPVGAGTIQRCVDRAEGPSGRVVASNQAPRCVLAQGRGRGSA
jgi:dolichyl-phosphate beta-glucosyltransferase